jgi:O-succinylbenzoate synthase
MSKVLIGLYQLQIPLKYSYKLSFKEVNYFDSIIINIKTGNKDIYSESTSLFGYSWEPFNEMWETAKAWLSQANGSLRDLESIIKEKQLMFPFTASPFLVSLEKLKASEFENTFEIKPVPLVGILSTDDLDKVRTETDSLIGEGYKTIKVKIKGDPEKDLEKISEIQRIIKDKAIMRIDANQAYTLKSIMPLINKIDPVSIELLEQPLNKDAWYDMRKLSRISSVPLMLDESIWSEDDILKTYDLKCARFVKLKLFKHSSFKKTLKLINLAKDKGLIVIFGNGVQTEIGCLDEAFIYSHSGLTTDAECNGFIKQKKSFFNHPLQCKNGKLIMEKIPKVDESVLRSCCISDFNADFINNL